MDFYQDGAIFSLNSKSLTLIDQFTYLGSNISSTESAVNKRMSKTWTAVYLTIIGKSDKIKTGNFPSFGRVSTVVWLHFWESIETFGEKARWELHKDAKRCCEQILEAAFYKTTVVDETLTGTNTPGKSGPGSNYNERVLHTPESFKIRVSRTNLKTTSSNGLLDMDTLELTDLQKLKFISSAWIFTSR